MKTEKVDRRIKYTTLLLRNALIGLMQSTPISKISVKMLCDSADINRSTFYAHFTDPHDLLQRLEQEVLANLNQYIVDHISSGQAESALPILRQVLEYAQKNADLFKVLLGGNSDAEFKTSIVELAQQKIIAQLKDNQNFDERTSHYLQCFILGGALNIMQSWLEDGMQETPEQMAELTSKLLLQGISSFFW